MTVSSILVLLSAIILLTAIDPIKDKEDCLKQLIKQYQNIKRFLNDIQTIDSNLKINLALLNSETSELKLRVAAHQDQQKLLLKMLQISFLHNTIKTWNCPAISAQHYKEITKIQNQIAFQAQENINTVLSQPYCFRNQQMKEQNLFLTTISKGLKEEIIEKCEGSKHLNLNIPFLDTEIARYYPNLATQSPWIYGKITQFQFKDKVQQLISLYGAFPCPLDSLFFQYKIYGQIYDISEKKCKNCGVGYLINGGLFNSNPHGTNTVGNIPNLIQGVPFCSKNIPFFDKKQCISCNLPLYFNFNNYKCQACPQDEGYDEVTKKCKSNVFFISFNSSHTNFIGNQIQAPLYSTLKKCPQNYPYTNGTTCQSCPLPNFYNYNSGECQACPGGLNFDLKTQSCVGGKGSQMNSNLLGMRNFIGKVPIYKSLFGICPLNKRFFNGIQCIECLLPQYFNFQSLRCQNCPLRMSFDSVIQACEYQNLNLTNLLSPNIYFNGNFNQLQNSFKLKKAKCMKQCESNQPFFDSRNNKCIQCPNLNPLFDIKRQLCMSCPKGSNYNPKLRSCLADKVQVKIQRMIMNSR